MGGWWVIAVTLALEMELYWAKQQTGVVALPRWLEPDWPDFERPISAPPIKRLVSTKHEDQRERRNRFGEARRFWRIPAHFRRCERKRKNNPTQKLAAFSGTEPLGEKTPPEMPISLTEKIRKLFKGWFKNILCLSWLIKFTN